MDNSTDVVKEGVTLRLILAVIGIDLVLLAIWVVGCCLNQKSFAGMMESFTDVMRNLATVSGAILGTKFAQGAIFKRGGTKYYTWKYGERRLSPILKKYDNYDNYRFIEKKIYEYLETKKEGSKDTIYFENVYALQREDHDFNKVWRDYNFIGAIKDMNEKEEKYYRRLERYIFINVYNKINREKAI